MQTSDLLNERWHNLSASGGTNVHQLYDAVHPLKLFFGYDVSGGRIFFLITPFVPDRIPPIGESLDMQLLVRGDGTHTLALRLRRPEQQAVFTHLCWDLAESTRSCQDEKAGTIALLERYRKWQRLLERGRGDLLSAIEVMGLVGELLFLQRFLFPSYGIRTALKGWLGPKGADQDFVFEDCWYEVKAADPAALSVRISSLQQLDAPGTGELCLIILDETGPDQPHAVSLNSLVADIGSSVATDPEAEALFEEHLDQAGYIDTAKYERPHFLMHRIRRFVVGEAFPRIRRETLDPAIVRATYDVSLASLAAFEIPSYQG